MKVIGPIDNTELSRVLKPYKLVATPDVSRTQEKYKRKLQLGKAPSIRSKCAWLSCGVLIISSLVAPDTL